MELSPPAADWAASFQLDARGLQDVLEVQSSERVTTIYADGVPVVVADGKRLHSSRNPIQEARRFARRQDVARATKVVLLGFGSGHLARALLRQTTAVIYCFEPDLEVLRVGLNHGPLEPRIQIITSPIELGEALYRTIGSGDTGKMVTWIPSVRQQPDIYELAAQRVNTAVERARCRDLTTQCRVDGWLDFYLTNLPTMVKSPGLAALRGQFRGRTAVVCSAGPSLPSNAKLLDEIRDDVVILAVNTAATALAKLGVKPHAIVSVESLDVTRQLVDIEWLSEVYAFLELTGNPKIFELPFKQVFPLSVDTSSCARFTEKVQRGNAFNAGFCVANAAVSLAQQLGCARIVLIGQDLAYKGDQVYSQGTIFENVRASVEGDRSRHVNVEIKKDIENTSQGTLLKGITQSQNYKAEWVEGWGGGPRIRTNQDFLHFRDWFIHAGPKLNEHGVEVFNCTEGGATITGWQEVPLATFIAEHKDELHISQETVPEQFARLAKLPAASMESMRKAVSDERDSILTLVRLGLESRARLNDDPDGDIRADPELSRRLAGLTSECLQCVQDAPIVREALTRPIQVLQERQELTLLSLTQAIEQQVVTLDARLATILDALHDDSLQAA